jgi:hypothetical protein
MEISPVLYEIAIEDCVVMRFARLVGVLKGV